MADSFLESVNRSADGMIRTHGDQALGEARKTLMRMVNQRDAIGERMWLAIIKAIERKQGERS